MAAVALASPAMANNPVFGPDGVDILGDGIFESQGSSFRFPAETDTNIDTLVVGNDMVRTFGSSDFFAKKTIATNNLEIKKNQDSGDCSPCDSCGDNCIKVNTENVRVGDRSAIAFGFSEATNNVKLVLNQQ